MSEELWAGAFGEEYRTRNNAVELARARQPFWDVFQDRHPFGSVLEVGCNAGANLAAITYTGSMFRPQVDRIAGVDVNEDALMAFKMMVWDTYMAGLYVFDPDRHEARVASAMQLPYGDCEFDLVFTSGLLIHVAPDDIGRAIDELVRVSRDLVLVIEYYAPVETVVPYRDQEAALWKRPWDRLIAERHSELCLLEQGPLLKADGWDDCMYYLWRKP